MLKEKNGQQLLDDYLAYVQKIDLSKINLRPTGAIFKCVQRICGGHGFKQPLWRWFKFMFVYT